MKLKTKFIGRYGTSSKESEVAIDITWRKLAFVKVQTKWRLQWQKKILQQFYIYVFAEFTLDLSIVLLSVANSTFNHQNMFFFFCFFIPFLRTHSYGVNLVKNELLWDHLEHWPYYHILARKLLQTIHQVNNHKNETLHKLQTIMKVTETVKTSISYPLYTNWYIFI